MCQREPRKCALVVVELAMCEIISFFPPLPQIAASSTTLFSDDLDNHAATREHPILAGGTVPKLLKLFVHEPFEFKCITEQHATSTHQQ